MPHAGPSPAVPDSEVLCDGGGSAAGCRVRGPSALVRVDTHAESLGDFLPIFRDPQVFAPQVLWPFIAGGRPPSRPPAFAAANPALVRSDTWERCRSARDANMSKIRFPCSLVACVQAGVAIDRKPFPLPEYCRLTGPQCCAPAWSGLQLPGCCPVTDRCPTARSPANKAMDLGYARCHSYSMT